LGIYVLESLSRLQPDIEYQDGGISRADVLLAHQAIKDQYRGEHDHPHSFCSCPTSRSGTA